MNNPVNNSPDLYVYGKFAKDNNKNYFHIAGVDSPLSVKKLDIKVNSFKNALKYAKNSIETFIKTKITRNCVVLKVSESKDIATSEKALFKLSEINNLFGGTFKNINKNKEVRLNHYLNTKYNYNIRDEWKKNNVNLTDEDFQDQHPIFELLRRVPNDAALILNQELRYTNATISELEEVCNWMPELKEVLNEGNKYIKDSNIVLLGSQGLMDRTSSLLDQAISAIKLKKRHEAETGFILKFNPDHSPKPFDAATRDWLAVQATDGSWMSLKELQDK